MRTERRSRGCWHSTGVVLGMVILTVAFVVSRAPAVRGARPFPAATVVPTVAATTGDLAGTWAGGYWLDGVWTFGDLELARERGRWIGHLSYPYGDDDAEIIMLSFDAPTLRFEAHTGLQALTFRADLKGNTLLGEVLWESGQQGESNASLPGSGTFYLRRIIFNDSDGYGAFVGDYRVSPEEPPLFVGRSGIQDPFYLGCQERQIGLRPLGGDRYLAATGHELVFERYHDGEVVGFSVEGRGPVPWSPDDETHRIDGEEDCVIADAVKVGNYLTEDVTFSNGDVTLAGTVLLPHGAGPFPAVVFTHGSGPETRERRRELAAAFARQGIAALIYDKRGTGGSEGDWFTASFDDLTGDALAGLRVLKPYPEIDLQAIGIWGLSQGGWVAPLAALWAGPEVAFVVTVSGAAMSPAAQEMYRWRHTLLDLGATRRELDAGLKAVWLQQSLNRLDVPGIDQLFLGLDFDHYALSVLERIQQPVLGIWGAEDRTVPPWTSAVRFGEALARGGNDDATLRVFPGAGHSMNLVSGAEMAGVPEGPWVVYAPGYVDLMVAWVKAHTTAVDPETGVDDAMAPFADVASAPDPERARTEKLPRATVPWYGQALVQVGALLGLGLVLLSGVGAWTVASIRESAYGGPRGGIAPVWAQVLAVLGALLAVALIASLMVALVTFLMTDEGALLDYLRSPVVMGGAWLAPVTAVGLALMAWWAWFRRRGHVVARVHLTVVAAAALGLLPLLGYWRLWG